MQMFKSIRIRISTLFFAIVLATEFSASLFCIYRAVSDFHSDFNKSLSEVFTDKTRGKLNDAANAISIPPEQEASGEIVMNETGPENIANVCDIIMLRADELNIGSSAVFYLLDADGNPLYSSAGNDISEQSPVIKEALKGNEATYNTFSGDYMDYALPLKSGDDIRYIVYIRDDLTAQHELVKSLWLNLAVIIAISVVIAYPLSILLFSRTVTAPIKALAAQAKRLADSESDRHIPRSDRNDELGELTDAIIYLAGAKKEQTDKSLAEKTKVEKILQNMNDGILAFDMKGRLTHINPEAKRLLNRNFVDDITFNKFFKEINANITIESLQYAQNDGSAEREVRLNGQVLQFNFALTSRDTGEGGVIVIIHDVTRHERLESARRDFVADVSHELRTPLTVIKSYADILADTPDAEPEVRTRFLDTISSETDRMTKIISDLLTLSKLDVNANYTRPYEDIDIRLMIEGLVERLSLAAKKKNQTLSYTPINDVPNLKGDRDGLERVLTNIISNALKYTPSGGEINIFSSKVYNDILVKVSDNGIGIPKEQLPNIFDRFYRVDKARSRDKGGTGLGLAIAKQTVESAFNGKILINSELNKGTDVIVSIPIPKK